MTPGTITFDMIGTCFSLAKPRQRLTELGAPANALELWFAQTLRDAFSLSHAGGYQPLKQMLEAELPRTLAQLGVETDSAQRSQVVSAFAELDLQPDALDTFEQLVNADWRLVALTNGSLDSTRKLLSRSDALQYFTEVHSCDEIQIIKPHPKVYALVQQNDSDATWMIAAHAWDIAGAVRASLKTAFITSGEGSYLSTYPDPTITAPSLAAAAAQILKHEM